MDIYKLEKIYEETMSDSADNVLKYAILETIPPIADYSRSIEIIRQNFNKQNDVRLSILGSFLSSTWEVYKDNDFLDEIKKSINNADNQQKSIFFYLIAYDIFMRGEISSKKNEYVDLLNKSIKLSEKFVYNYYRLAQVSDRQIAKELMKVGLSQIEKIFSENDCKKLDISYFVSFNSFLNEHILGVHLTDTNYASLKDFYNSLCSP